jgi:hypothetical protein
MLVDSRRARKALRASAASCRFSAIHRSQLSSPCSSPSRWGRYYRRPGRADEGTTETRVDRGASPCSCRTPLDAACVRPDSRVHRATGVAPDLIAAGTRSEGMMSGSRLGGGVSEGGGPTGTASEQAGQRGVVFRLRMFSRVAGPGIVVLISLLERLLIVDRTKRCPDGQACRRVNSSNESSTMSSRVLPRARWTSCMHHWAPQQLSPLGNHRNGRGVPSDPRESRIVASAPDHRPLSSGCGCCRLAPAVGLVRGVVGFGAPILWAVVPGCPATAGDMVRARSGRGNDHLSCPVVRYFYRRRAMFGANARWRWLESRLPLLVGPEVFIKEDPLAALRARLRQ